MINSSVFNIKLTQIAPLAFVFLWSTGFIGAKYGLPYIEPFFLLSIRFFINIIIFFCLIQILKIKRISLQEVGVQMFIGVLLHGLYLGGVFYAIDNRLSAGVVAIIVGLQPVITTIMGHFWLNDRVNKYQALGLALGLVGIIIVISNSYNIYDNEIQVIALIASFVALLGISLGTVLQKKMAQNIPLLTGVLYQYLGAFIVVAIFSYLFEVQEIDYTWELFLTIVWLALGLSVIAVLLLMYMIKKDEASKVASYFYLVPLLTVLEAWILFDETMNFISVAGLLIAIVGVYLCNKKIQHKEF